MCGIAGYFGMHDIPAERVQTCLALMGRRGPDADGARRVAGKLGRNCLLLHSRLSIIDLDERANQPFHVNGKWLTYNGEIYNYVELREALAKQCCHFVTQSDTEVLLTEIDRSGVVEAVTKAEGMWAFAVFDENSGTLTLSRDRFGEKPLYLHRTADGIFFGSEPKFIFALMGRRLPVNETQLLRYIVNGYKSLYKQADTFFEGLEELRPQTVLHIDAMGRERQTRYWTPAYQPDETISHERAVEGVRERLIEAVRLRLRSDVPLAFLLSGGVDSNVLTAIARKLFDYDVHAFTIINEDERYDERALVEQTVEELGIRHTPVPITPQDFLSRLRELVSYHDAPVYTITYYVQWLLMRAVHDYGYRITVSGTGADEVFSGYYDHHLMHLQAVSGTKYYAPTRAAWERHIQPLVRNPYLGTPTLFEENWHFRDHIYLGADEFVSYLRKPFAEAFREEAYTQSLLRNRMMNEMFHESVPVILHEDDLNAMYYSIENRSPFLDRNLFEFCYTIPDRYLIRDGFNKVLLRDAARGIAPDHILDRRMKVGFNAPVHSFLDPDRPEVKAELTADGPLFDIMHKDKVTEFLDQRGLPNSKSKFLFNLVNVKVFLEAFAP